jgi:DNA-directed RNA polymerase I, II, and III subunit RPABC2
VNGVDHDQEMANGEEAVVGAGLAGERQPNKVRVTTPYLTKYERARVLGTRALQIRSDKSHPDWRFLTQLFAV